MRLDEKPDDQENEIIKGDERPTYMDLTESDSPQAISDDSDNKDQPSEENPGAD